MFVEETDLFLHGTERDYRNFYPKPPTGLYSSMPKPDPEDNLEDDELDLFSTRIFDRPNKINSLPKEILLRIFEEVYQASCRIEVDSPRLRDIVDSRLFPDCIANVCKTWRELVQSVALFSTRLFIFIDEPVSKTKLRTKFELSKNLPIKVFIIRRDYAMEEDVDEERRVARATSLLVRHVARCEVVIFDLLKESSLPRISDFSGTVKDLRLLTVKSRIVDPRIGPFGPTPSPLRQFRFCCPNLRIMDLDCSAFLDASSIPGWLESTQNLGQKELTIRRGQDIQLYHFLVCLSKLGHLFLLKLIQVDLDRSSCLGANLVSIFIQNFELEGLSGESVSGFFDNHINTIEVSSITLIRCGLEARENLASWSLLLSDIDPEQDVVEFVRHWNGHSLSINNCPGVDDTMLVMLSDFQTSREDSLLNAHSLRELQIKSSEIIPISVKSLQELVIIRKEVSERHDPADRAVLGSGVTLPMYSVYISGLGRKLDLVDRKWFDDYLDNFSWLADQVPTDSPILDWDVSQLDSSQLEHLDLDVRSAYSDTLVSSSQPAESCLSPSARCTSAPESPVLKDDVALFEWSPEDLLMIP